MKSISIGILAFLLLLDGFIPPASLPPNGPEDSDHVGRLFVLNWIWHQTTFTQFLLSIFGSCLTVLIFHKYLNHFEKVKDCIIHNGKSNDSLSNWDAVGITMALLGWSLRQWSKQILAQNFTYQISKPTKLIDDVGPYVYMLHPGYSGALLHMCGLLWVWNSMSCRERAISTLYQLAGIGIILSILSLAIVRRIHDEEELLLETFGELWVSHASSRWRLVPYLY